MVRGSYQRRRGQWVTFYPPKETIDRRGAKHLEADLDKPNRQRVVLTPIRSGRAELPGQAEIDLYKVVFDDAVEISLWGAVEWDGEWWDVVTPAQYRHGTKHSRHKSIDIRRRPSGRNL